MKTFLSFFMPLRRDSTCVSTCSGRQISVSMITGSQDQVYWKDGGRMIPIGGTVIVKTVCISRAPSEFECRYPAHIQPGRGVERHQRKSRRTKMLPCTSGPPRHQVCLNSPGRLSNRYVSPAFPDVRSTCPRNPCGRAAGQPPTHFQFSFASDQ